MHKPLPSLIALRFFEAAGRLQSFSNAALELHVTQGAVSRQIRALEEELNAKLFNRLTRKVELTDAGRNYLADVDAAFARLRAGTERLKAQQEHTTLRISVLPSIGSSWLMPRLGSFTREYPYIEIRISSSIEPANLQTGAADIAIRVGAKPGQRYDANLPQIDLVMTEDWRDVLAEELIEDVLVPVYSPNILETNARLDDEGLFHTLPLIHTTSRSDAWNGWMKAFNLHEMPATPRIEYGHFFMSLDAARQGLGVALIPEVIFRSSNTQGLHCATRYRTRSAGEYYMLSLSRRAESHHISVFRDWVRKQFETFRSPIPAPSASLPA
ncbi:LysR substrate-binding domain-containing protein [Bordetella trematum]|uniref:LysR substrate-binding domain-containing protein n=1 Tax=Bordetella trematum TaxID=123899 RepID=UPI0004710702|nr:LysR substrate-binding domain-containing protein [Bordetella trematum]